MTYKSFREILAGIPQSSGPLPVTAPMPMPKSQPVAEAPAAPLNEGVADVLNRVADIAGLSSKKGHEIAHGAMSHAENTLDHAKMILQDIHDSSADPVHKGHLAHAIDALNGAQGQIGVARNKLSDANVHQSEKLNHFAAQGRKY